MAKINRRGFLVGATDIPTISAVERYTKQFKLTGEPLIEVP